MSDMDKITLWCHEEIKKIEHKLFCLDMVDRQSQNEQFEIIRLQHEKREIKELLETFT